MQTPATSDAEPIEASLASETTRSAVPPVIVQPVSNTHHWVLFGLAVGVLVMAFLMRVDGPTNVALPGMTTPLPSICMFVRTTGLDCPGCGLTRCFISLAHGDLPSAWRFNAAGLLLFPVVAFQIPYRAVQLWRIRQGKSEFNLASLHWVCWVIVAALLIQWIVKILGGTAG